MRMWIGVLGGMIYASAGAVMGSMNAGRLGRATQLLLVIGPSLYALSWVVEFAILGTVALGSGLICLSVVAVRRRLVP